MTVARPAHAKLNLALSVGPPAPEGSPHTGLHPIASWICAIDLADRVTVTLVPRERARLEIIWQRDAARATPIDWPADDDLARRAAALVIEHAGEPRGAHVVVEKRIPVGAGLGGGSSDAAAAMLAANDQLESPLPHDRLVELSAEIGSDVAYFLQPPSDARPRPAIVTGFGQHVETAPARSAALVLILPPFQCPTGAVYRAFDELTPRATLREREIRDLANLPPDTPFDRLSAQLFNDLGPAAEHVRPELAAIRRAIEPLAPTPVHLTGSGSALFVLCDPAEADGLSRRFVSAAPNLRALPARLA